MNDVPDSTSERAAVLNAFRGLLVDIAYTRFGEIGSMELRVPKS
jgi:hypothetical protein